MRWSLLNGITKTRTKTWYKADDVYRVLEQLQSAQPEIIRCKECVYADDFYHCDYMSTWNDAECFCSMAKRRTDGN